jgi:DNA-binding NtrC family response regulator
MFSHELNAFSGKVLLPCGMGLVVDQDPRDLNTYAGILHHMGFAVKQFAEFQQAVHCLDDETPDFVLTSQGSLAFEGRMVVARVMARNRKIPVVVTSRSLDIACYLEAMQLGAVDYVEKPLSREDVEHLVTTYWQPRPDAIAKLVWEPGRVPLAANSRAANGSARG